MHILLTGGAGFIGSHLTEVLLPKGHRLTIVDNLSSGTRENLPPHSRLQLVVKNIQDLERDDLESFDVLIHLAAIANVQQTWDYPEQTQEDNLTSILRLLDIAGHHGCKKIIFASSAAVYGDQESNPITENLICSPLSPYGIHKYAVEHYLRVFSEKLGIQVFSLRLFNVYGPRQAADSSYAGVITIFCERVLHGQPLIIHGDGSQTRDFIYVKDVAQAFVRALEFQSSVTVHYALNIGTGIETSIYKLADFIRQIGGRPALAIRQEPKRLGDIERSCANITHAGAILNYMPQWRLESGLKVYLEWLNSIQSTQAYYSSPE